MIAVVIAQIIYLIIIRQICLHDITDTGIDSIEQTGETGFMSFDFHRRYLGCNDAVIRHYPAFAQIKVDAVIPPRHPVARTIKGWLDAFEEDEDNDRFYYELEGRIYLVTVSYLCVGSRRRGYQLIITDDTENQQYIALLNNFNSRLKEENE